MMTMPMMMRFHRPSVRWRLRAPPAEDADAAVVWLCSVTTRLLGKNDLSSFMLAPFLPACGHHFTGSRRMNLNALHHTVNYTGGTGIVRVQSNAQAQMISEQLRADDLIWSAQSVVFLRGYGRDNLVE
jgi:hypothetical protein